MAYYRAEVIDLSLSDAKMIRKFEIVDVKKRFCGLLKIYTIAIPEEKIGNVVISFQKNLSTKLKKEWYITFHNAEHVIIVFRKRIFYLSGRGIEPVPHKLLDTTHAVEKDKWDEMIKYAKSLGVPDNQCDFLPENFEKQKYC
ncbi:MAG: hypothetical protein MR531_13730 [Lachnospiraceae bacterium]|nr:hypothetical protein [Lachnospiraceae bacterium]